MTFYETINYYKAAKATAKIYREGAKSAKNDYNLMFKIFFASLATSRFNLYWLYMTFQARPDQGKEDR